MKSKTRKIPVSGRETQTDFDKPNTLHHLFEENLLDIYDAEQQLIDSLPDFAEAAESQDLKDAFLNHLKETQNQAERVEKIFTRLNIERETTTCEAMQGLIEETKEMINEFEESAVRDSALIIAVQKIEHYEIATYGSLCELADVLGLNKTRDILARSLEEEKYADELLTDIAQEVNDEACEMSVREKVY